MLRHLAAGIGFVLHNWGREARGGDEIGFVSHFLGWGSRRDGSGTGAVWGLGSFRIMGDGRWRSGVEEKRRSGEVIGFVSRNAGWGSRRDASGTRLGLFRVFGLLAVGDWLLAGWNWVCFVKSSI